MKMNIICGKNCSAQGIFCIDKIKKIKSENQDAQVIVIVPDQFSYATERLITESFGGSGLNGIEVMTFSRLSSRYLERVRKKELLTSGKMMLILNALNSVCEDDEENIYSKSKDKPGTVAEMESVFSEFKRYMITPEILSETAKSVSQNMLNKKLTALSKIYAQYLKLISLEFHDSDDDILHLAEKIIQYGYLKDTYFIFNEFSDFLPQHYKAIEAMLKNCKEVSVLLDEGDNNEEFMKIPQMTKNRLISISKKSGAKIEITKNDISSTQFNSAEIEFYYKNYSNFANRAFVPYADKTNDISVFSARDPYSEVERVAKKIRALVEKDGLRYSDIGVVFGNTKEYNHIIQAVFGDYDIPYFTDTKLPVTEHPVVASVLGVFDIIDKNWSYDAVFGYLKSGFIYEKNDDGISSFSNDDIDFLESFVLKKGIKGKKSWLDSDDWKYSCAGLSDALNEAHQDEENTKRINDIRRRVTKPIELFGKKVKGRKTVRELATAFYEFLCDINLYDGISLEMDKLSELCMRNEAQQLSLVWNMLIETINQSVTVLGDEVCSRKEFCDYLFAGLSACSIDIIPSSLDSVTVGGADSARQKNVKALFVIGAVRGEIPPEVTNEGILSDRERGELSQILADSDLEIGQDTAGIKIASQYKFYKVLFTATDKIYVSYPLNNFEGESKIPSEFVFNLSKIFENLTHSDDLINREFDGLITSAKSAFNYLMQNRGDKHDPNVKRLIEWFSKRPRWSEKLTTVEFADNYKKQPLRISPENAQELYKDLFGYSVTRINEFSSCPFKYFLKYGLGAKEQEVWKIRKLDLGSIIHLVICNYCIRIENDAKTFDELKKNWDMLTKEKSEKIVDEVIEEIANRIMLSVNTDEAKLAYIMARIAKMIKRSVETVRLSLKNGGYAAAEHEKSFRVNLSFENEGVMINGTIDRIDVLRDSDENARLRIIDYKSGRKDFSVVSISNMLDVQLIVYAACAAQLYKKNDIRFAENTNEAQICGLMYNKIRDDIKEVNPEDIKMDNEQLIKDMKLSGIVILDEKDDGDNGGYDIENALLMDYNLKERGESEYLNIKLKKTGELYQSSEVTSRSDFNKLVKYVEKNIIHADKKIKSGDISIRPYKDNQSMACRFCNMAEICLFDENKDSVRNLCTNKDYAWEIINAELDKKA